MADKLTPQQMQAVVDRGGNLLVSAAAGSGKTKVLVDRLMGYLTDPDHPANIDEFLMITYTKAAAAELRGKIAAKLSERLAQEPNNRHMQKQLQRLYLTKISTVHAFCGDVLREYAYRLNIPGDFRVADENECAEIRISVANKLLEQAYDGASDNTAFCAFVDSQGFGRDDRQIPEIILQVYDSARCHLHPQQWMDHCLEAVEAKGVTDASETVFGQFLIQRLHRWLDLQIEALGQCNAKAVMTDGFEKPAALLTETIAQLTVLRSCDRWDRIALCKNISFGTLRFPKNCVDTVLAEQIKAVREACKKGYAKQIKPFADGSQQVLADLQNCAEATHGLMELVEAFTVEYEKVKRSRRILDFSDLEHKMLDLLLGTSRGNLTGVAVEVGNRFREIMVDEYQDSNEVQDAIYEALSRKKQNLFMVGDVKQSIYQFRLADPGIFLKKYASYVPADQAQPGQGRKVVLSHNFRSGGGVLAGANDVFRICMTPEVGGLYYGDAEALHEGVPHVALPGAETELLCVDVQADTYAEEAAVTAQRIRKMLDSGECIRDGDSLRPVKAEDIVILLRSPGSSAGYYRQALERVGIRCTTGGGEDLLQAEEIAALRCLLQAIHNPRLDIPLIGAMASPIFGFTADDLARIRAGSRDRCFYESLQLHQNEKTQTFLHTLSTFRAASKKQNLTGLMQQILVQTSLEDVYGVMADGNQKIANLQAFFQIASNFESAGYCDLGRFLEYLDNMEQKGLVIAGEDGTAGTVSIMSIHKSKGLEFPVVFLCGLGREFNMESQRANVLCHKDFGVGLSAVDREKRIRYPSIAKRAIAAQIGAESISEEMRVLYVAMTRPKDRLIMTYASNRLEKDITELVNRMTSGGCENLIREAVCPGEWVLLTALHRTEAGALFAIGGNPGSAMPGEPRWDIQVVRAPELTPQEMEAMPVREMDHEALTRIQQSLRTQYPYMVATGTPSKQTATQKKGRVKDQEAAEDTQEQHVTDYFWRKPGFAKQEIRGKEYGNAVHAAMQYLNYSVCNTEAGVCAELQRLVEDGYLSAQQTAMIHPQIISDFFDTEVGRKLMYGNIEREFKFSILEDGGNYDPALSGEKVLLQGVVDCLLIEKDGLTVLDFKTDYVKEETLSAVVDRYRPQVITYAEAMQRIFRKPIKETLLYFFHMNKFVPV